MITDLQARWEVNTLVVVVTTNLEGIYAVYARRPGTDIILSTFHTNCSNPAYASFPDLLLIMGALGLNTVDIAVEFCADGMRSGVADSLPVMSPFLISPTSTNLNCRGVTDVSGVTFECYALINLVRSLREQAQAACTRQSDDCNAAHVMETVFLGLVALAIGLAIALIMVLIFAPAAVAGVGYALLATIVAASAARLLWLHQLNREAQIARDA